MKTGAASDVENYRLLNCNESTRVKTACGQSILYSKVILHITILLSTYSTVLHLHLVLPAVGGNSHSAIGMSSLLSRARDRSRKRKELIKNALGVQVSALEVIFERFIVE